MTWEYSFLRWVIETFTSPFLSGLFSFITLLGEGAAIFFLISFIMLFFKKTRKTGIVSIVGLVLIAGLNNFGIKYIVGRPRPFLHPELGGDALWLHDYIENFKTLSNFNKNLVPTSFAFVSGHTLSAFIWGFVVAIYHRKWTIPAVLFSTVMAFTRLYFGFHYPTDVIAGIILALITAIGFAKLADINEAKVIAWWQKKRNKNKVDQ